MKEDNNCDPDILKELAPNEINFTLNTQHDSSEENPLECSSKSLPSKQFSKVSSVPNIPVSSYQHQYNLQKQRNCQSKDENCQCSMSNLPPCYSCSSKSTLQVPQIRFQPPSSRRKSCPAFRTNGEVHINNLDSSPNDFFNLNCQRNPNIAYVYRGDGNLTPIPSPSAGQRMPKVAEIFCKHRIRKACLSVPLGILATIGILGTDASIAVLFNTCAIVILVVFYPLLGILDYAACHMYEHIHDSWKKRSQSNAQTNANESNDPCSSHPENIQRLRSFSHCSKASSLPSIAEEDDERFEDENIRSSVAEFSSNFHQHSNQRQSRIKDGVVICVSPGVQMQRIG